MRGTALLYEKEIFTVTGDPTEAKVSSKCNSLSASNRAAFDSLKSPNTTPSNKEIFETMNFTMHKTQRGQHTSGIFVEAARINHSCIPNAYWMYNTSLEYLTIHAMVDIAKGDEITIHYFKLCEYSSRQQREEMLQSYGFHCDCIACDVQSDFGRGSDERRDQMRRLQNKLDENNYLPGSSFERCNDIRKLEDLLRQEKLNYPMRANMCHLEAEGYRDTLSRDIIWAPSLKSENVALALERARKELEYDVACTGNRSPEVTKTLNFIRQLKSL